MIQRPPFAMACLLALVLAGAAPLAQAQEPPKMPLPPRANDDVWSVAISRDGKTLAASSGWWDNTPGDVGVWDLETKKPRQRFSEARGVASVALSADAKLLATGSWTGHVRLYDWAAAREVADFEVEGVARVAFSPNDQLLASATERKTLQLWDVPGRKHLADLEGELMRFLCVRFSPDGKKVLAGGGDWKPGGVNQVVIWDVESKMQVQKLVGHQNAVTCITYSPDGKTIATGSIDKTIRLWDADTAKLLKTLIGHTHWTEALVFSADGKTLISSSHDHTVRFWDLETDAEDKARRMTLPGSVRTICLTPDEKWLIVGGSPKLLKVYDSKTLAQTDVLWDGSAPRVLRDGELIIAGKKGHVVLPPQEADMDNLPIAVPAPANNRVWLVAALAFAFVVSLLFLFTLVGVLVWRRRAAGG